VYIPTPSEELEPLKLAPVDDREEQRRRAQEEEDRRLAQRILREKEAPPESAGPPRPAAEPVGDVRLTAANMENLVIDYARCMAKGALAEAEELAVEIRTNMRAAEEVMQRLTMDEMPPAAVAHIPRPVLAGFFRQLRERR
jgi:hypothetical protein